MSSEVPYMEGLGADLPAINEEDLLRYFLNEDFEQSPFDSKVPNCSPLLDPPTISLALPKQPTVQQQKQATTPAPAVVVKKEIQQSTTQAKSNKSRGKTQAKQTTITANPPLITAAHLPNKAIPTQPKNSPTKTTTINPITTMNASTATQNTTISPLAIQIKDSTTTTSPNSSPMSSTSTSPMSSPTPSPVPEDDKAGKRQRRLLKNRESAQLSRIRKKMYIDELERKVNALVSENSGLREEVGHLNDVLKQVAGDAGDAKNLSRAEIVQAITTNSSASNSHHQARKYAGVCLLVVLFSLGLFLNVASPNSAVQSDRLIELDRHNNKNGSSVNFGDYNMGEDASISVQTEEHRIIFLISNEFVFSLIHEALSPGQSSKRAWEEELDMDDFEVASPKRARTDSYCIFDVCYSLLSPLISEAVESEMLDDEDSLFDVLEDDAFSDDGTLTTPNRSPASPLSPCTAVPSTPPVPALGSPQNAPEISVSLTSSVI